MLSKIFLCEAYVSATSDQPAKCKNVLNCSQKMFFLFHPFVHRGFLHARCLFFQTKPSSDASEMPALILMVGRKVTCSVLAQLCICIALLVLTALPPIPAVVHFHYMVS